MLASKKQKQRKKSCNTYGKSPATSKTIAFKTSLKKVTKLK